MYIKFFTEMIDTEFSLKLYLLNNVLTRSFSFGRSFEIIPQIIKSSTLSYP